MKAAAEGEYEGDSDVWSGLKPGGPFSGEILNFKNYKDNKELNGINLQAVFFIVQMMQQHFQPLKSYDKTQLGCITVRSKSGGSETNAA